MGQKVFNSLSITGFADDTARSEFEAAAAKGSIPFSFERLLPLSEPEEIEREHDRLYRELHPEKSAGRAPVEISGIDMALTWGSWIFEEEGHFESVNNRKEEFSVAGEPGLVFHFESWNDPPFNGIRHLSKRHPKLLFRLYSEDDMPSFGFALYKNGKRFAAVFEEEEFRVTRAAEWPLIAALQPENRQDENLHRFLRDAADKLREDDSFEKELEEIGEEERRRIREYVEFDRERLKRRRKERGE